MRDLLAQRELAERVSVVIPARNEARNLPHVLDALPPGLHEVILVDGHSVDDTIEVARRIRPDIKIVHQTRRGKGNALACGFAEVTGDIIVMLDADGSADPDEIAAFVAALASGADFAKGTRFSKGGHSHDITRYPAAGQRSPERPGKSPFRHGLHRSVLRLQRIPRLSAPGARPAPGAFPWRAGRRDAVG